jgi:hypothetical protein
MPTFSADQIIGKTLIAKKTVTVYDLPFYADGAKVLTQVRPGQSIGKVFSYVGGTPGKPLNWQFEGAGGRMYYVPHVSSYFDVPALRDQGTQTTAEIKEKQESENMSTGDKFAQYLKKSGNVLLYGGLALVALNVFLKNRKR